MATRKAITEMKKSFQTRFKYAILAKPKIYDEKFQNIVDQLVIKFKSI